MNEVTFRTSELRERDIDSFPEVLLFGFLKPTIAERAVRVGEYLRQISFAGTRITLIVDDREPPVGWKYAAHKIVREIA